MTSTAQTGQAMIELSLDDNLTAVEKTQTEMQVMQAVSSTNLPSSIPSPSVRLVGGGLSGLMSIAILSKSMSVFDMDNFLLSKLIPKFSAIPGVIVFSSGDNPEVSIALDPTKIAQHQLNPLNVASIVNTNSQFDPLGNMFIDQQQYPLNLKNNISSLYNFRHMLVGYTAPLTNNDTSSTKAMNYLDGQPIYLNDIAKVSFIPTPTANAPYNNFSGKHDAFIDLETRNNANPITGFKRNSPVH